MSSKWLTPEIEERLARRRRRSILWTAGVISLFFANDLTSGGANTWRLMFGRACWALSLAMAALLLVKASPSSRRLLLRLAAASSGACFSSLVLLKGGYNTEDFAVLLSAPLCIMVLLQDEVGATALGVVTVAIGVATILYFAHPDFATAVRWMSMLFATSSVAMIAAVNQRSQLREESVTASRLADSEQARAQAERLALVGQLAAGVAHEINNPLAFATANLAFIAEELPAGADELRSVIAETRSGLKRVAAIVGDLTAFSRGNTDATGPVDLHTVVAEAQRLASIRTKDRVEVVNQLAVDLPIVIGNERHLCQVFLNLMLNAADELNAAGVPGGIIWVHATTKDGQLRVDVDDNGRGIPASALKRLFTPFFTTKPVGKGTGLGLATSREYLRRAGGDLQASMRPGGGARFTLSLALASEAPPVAL